MLTKANNQILKNGGKIKRAVPGQARSPLLQMYIDEGGADVKERIEKFERESQIKGLSVMFLVCSAIAYYKSQGGGTI